jgi:uncharacterized protein (TIGR00369 family)
MSRFSTIQKKPLKVLNPDFEKKIRDSVVYQGALHALGAEVKKIELGYVEIHIPFSKAVQQQHGLFHGGMVALAADSASGYATYTVLPEGEECVSAEFKVNFLYPARGEKLISRGGIIKVGRTLVIAEATVSVVKDGEETECALMLHTLARVKHFKSGAHG